MAPTHLMTMGKEKRGPVKVLLSELKENDSDKENGRENTSRDTAEVDSRGPTELLDGSW